MHLSRGARLWSDCLMASRIGADHRALGVGDRSQVILRSKLHERHPHPDWVQRTKLLGRLDAQRDACVTLISAPAGYGKSTLIAQWKATHPRPFAWVSLDASDNDPTRFWSYVVASVENVIPDLHDVTGRIRSWSELRNVALPQLLNALAEIDEGVVVVLDDYHHITNPACHEFLSFAIDNLPPEVQLVISTRADPPLHLAKLRVEHKLNEMRAVDLSFDLNEVATLLRSVSGRARDPAEVEAVATAAEGWPAGVYLAALILSDEVDVAALVRAITDSPLLSEYLTTEVLQRQPPDIYAFLTRTSILEAFTSESATAVVESGDQAELLQVLERSNFFLVPLDTNRKWYRYHVLFQQLLAEELRRSEPDLIPELHRRAAEWYRSRNLVSRALHHAIEGGNLPLIRELVWENLLPFANAGRLETLGRWMEAIDRTEIAADPLLSLAAGWISGFTGRCDEVEFWLAAARRGDPEAPLPNGSGTLSSGIALLNATCESIGVAQALAEARVAVASVEDGWRPLALFTLGYLLHLSGDHNEANARLEEASSASHPDMPVFEMASLAEQSLLASDRGDRALARSKVEAASVILKGSTLGGLTQASFVHTAWGTVLGAEGDLGGARDHLEKAIALRDSFQHPTPLPTLQTLIALSGVRFELGDRDGARELLHRAISILELHPDAGSLLTSTKRLQRSLGGTSQRPSLYGESLTDRELVVLRLLNTSLTHREIGNALFISLNTVKSHVRSLYQKLMVSSRSEALAKGTELGLL